MVFTVVKVSRARGICGGDVDGIGGDFLVLATTFDRMENRRIMLYRLAATLTQTNKHKPHACMQSVAEARPFG